MIKKPTIHCKYLIYNPPQIYNRHCIHPNKKQYLYAKNLFLTYKLYLCNTIYIILNYGKENLLTERL